MYLESDKAALRAYLAGDRESAAVAAYFQRFDIAFPEKNSKEKAERENIEKADMVTAENLAQTRDHA